MDIKFYLPGFTKNLSLNIALVESLKRHGECYYDNIRVASLYGTFPNAIWNGGRNEFGSVDLSRFQDVVNLVNAYGIAIRYTFTNCLIREEHLCDEYCNELMGICNNGQNEVLVNSPLLESYLRKHYPGFKYILSTTALTRGSESINAACSKYDLVVADYRDVPDRDFLQGISMRDKVEIMLNESCVYDCKFRSSHYDKISRAQLLLQDSDEVRNCIYHDTSRFKEAYVSKDTLFNVLIPMGFTNFKIRGREMSAEKLLNEYLMFLVKPDYVETVRSDFANIAP